MPRPQLLLRLVALGAAAATADAIDTLPVNLDAYQGRWFQMYADAFVTKTFERDAYCVTADYALNGDGTIAVLNGQRTGSIDGPVGNVTATATPTDVPGQLTVVFDEGAPFPAPYWVVGLSPISSTTGLYDWAIVTDNNMLSLFVLARDVAVFESDYDDEVTALMADLGFGGLKNSPIPTVQDGCTYPAPPAQATATKTAATASVPASSSSSASTGDDCSVVTPLTDLDLDAFVAHSWYIQQQQLTKYQPSTDDLYCVAATYDVSGDNDHAGKEYTVPRFSGTVLGVYNYANSGEVNGPNFNNDTVLCAREPDASVPGALAVAPCFLPNSLAGDYWVIAVGEATATSTTNTATAPSAAAAAAAPSATMLRGAVSSSNKKSTESSLSSSPSLSSSASSSSSSVSYEWAVVSGGQPTVAYPDGGCTTKLDTTNGSGLWIFSASPSMDSASLAAARQALVDLGYTTSQLLDVPQDGCKYEGAFLKE